MLRTKRLEVFNQCYRPWPGLRIAQEGRVQTGQDGIVGSDYP